MILQNYSVLFGSFIFTTYFWWCLLTPTEWHFVDFVNLIFHEAGHTITFFLPGILTALAGSVLQILIPTICAVYFYQRGELLSMNLLCLWISQNVVSVSVYVRDAQLMNLPLLGGESVTHDWNFILGSIGRLNESTLFANVLLIVAYTIAIGCTAQIIQYFWHQIEAGDSVKTGK